ncbi:MAG: hemerythrin domain-containing protein [Candidatus Omnitrophota bacterium]|nr:hemerythrin domain-containing protein [Candidatus Omnitrophota bacterium]MDZ4241237.1 hemerythrin domain-containing protein [Candidatus Omnitrophota bacterium]
MIKKISNFETSIHVLGDNHEDLLDKTNQLDDALTRLRYEGKLCLKKNIRSAEKLVGFFNATMLPHIVVEDILFDFVERHIPKIQIVVRHLQSEHKELTACLKEMAQLLRRLAAQKSEPRRAEIIERVKERGTYLSHFMRQHIQIEHDSIYLIAMEELQPAEKRRLLQKLHDCPSWKALLKNGAGRTRPWKGRL